MRIWSFVARTTQDAPGTTERLKSDCRGWNGSVVSLAWHEGANASTGSTHSRGFRAIWACKLEAGRNLFTATSLRSMLGKSNCTLTTPLGDEGERSTAGEYGRKGPTADDELTAFPRYVFFPGKSPGDDHEIPTTNSCFCTASRLRKNSIYDPQRLKAPLIYRQLRHA